MEKPATRSDNDARQLLPKGRWQVRVRRQLRGMKAQMRRRVTTRVSEWTGPTAQHPPSLLVRQQAPAEVRITAESVGRLRQQLATELPENVRLFELQVADWRRPWTGWSGRLGPLPGLVQHEVRLPAKESGPASVRVELAEPAPLGTIVAAVLPVLEPWHPLPARISPELAITGGPPRWLVPEETKTDPAHFGPANKTIQPHDLHLSTSGTTDQPDTWVASPYEVRSPLGAQAILVDATTANPCGRERYGSDLPTGLLRLAREGDAVWWRILRSSDGTTTVVTGRAGDPLDGPQRDVLARLGAVVASELPADVPPPAAAGVLAQLAMTGVVLQVAGLSEATAALLAPDLLALARAPLPGRDADPVDWEIRSITQRRATLRHHAVGFAWPGLVTSRYAGAAGPPTVSALLVTRRPGQVLGALSAMAAQTYPALEIVVGLHGCELAADDQARLAELGVPVQVLSIPARFTLGEALAEAGRRASGSLVTKVDDDDRYGPEHVWDLVLARHYSNATLVGRGAEFVYLEARGVTVRRYMGSELYSDVVAGGTMLLSRGDLEAIGGWRPVPRSVDRGLLDRVLREGGLVYRTHAFGFIYTRHSAGHTWDPGLDYFLNDPRQAWPGVPPYGEFGIG